jgi:hypothetical protein
MENFSFSTPPFLMFTALAGFEIADSSQFKVAGQPL